MFKETVDRILNRYHHNPQYLIPVLQDIQVSFRCLPKDAILLVAEGLSVPLTRVYGAATFYKAFSLTPRGKHLVQVCTGTACHVRGSMPVLEAVERCIGINVGCTTEDGEYTLEGVNCLGTCAIGPVVVIDGEYHGQMTPAKVAALFNGKAAPAERSVAVAQA